MRKRLCQRRTLAFALFCLFLSVLGMAQFESWHRALHCDAAQPEHRCAVTLMKAGQIDSPSVAVAVVTVADGVPISVRSEGAFVFQPEFGLLPSRGPPALC